MGWVRWRLLSAPIERDEGCYAYIAQRLLAGVPPFASGYSMHMPFLYVIYAVILELFGQTASAIHAGLLVANFITAAIICLIGKKRFGVAEGCLSAAFFLVLSAARWVDGLHANAEHFVVLFVTAGYGLILLRGEKPGSLFDYLPGVMFGLAFVTKQTSIVFFLPVLIAAYADPASAPGGSGRIIRLVRILAGSAVPVVMIFLWMMATADFERFWFWTFTYPLFYGIPSGSTGAFTEFFHSIARTAGPVSLIWLLAAAGLLFALIRNPRSFPAVVFAGWLVAGLLAVMQGFYFRPHYFLLINSPLALCAGCLLPKLVLEFSKRRTVLAGILLASGILGVGQAMARHSRLWFVLTPEEYTRTVFYSNPFPESPRIAEWIDQNTRAEDRVAILGSEPQIYFYSKRISATPYVWTYSLMEPTDFALEMQKDMAAGIEAAKPAVVVVVNGYASWLPVKNSSHFIFEWVDRYLGAYEKAGLVDIYPGKSTEYVFGPAALEFKPRNHFWITLYRRKPDAG